MKIKELYEELERLSQDITWDQDDLIDSEQDVNNTEVEDQDETDLYERAR